MIAFALAHYAAVPAGDVPAEWVQRTLWEMKRERVFTETECFGPRQGPFTRFEAAVHAKAFSKLGLGMVQGRLDLGFAERIFYTVQLQRHLPALIRMAGEFRRESELIGWDPDETLVNLHEIQSALPSQWDLAFETLRNPRSEIRNSPQLNP